MAHGEWYWCLKHQAVEPYEGCRSEERLGPYETQAEAASALQKVAERNKQFDHDPRFVDLDENGEPVEGWGPFSG
jgi:hypothetical protein